MRYERRSQPELEKQPVGCVWVCVNRRFLLSDWSDSKVSEVLW